MLTIEDNSFEISLSLCQNKDPKIRLIIDELVKRQSNMYEMRNGVIYKKRGDELLLYVPEGMEHSVIHKYHDKMAHMATEKTCSVIAQNYWYPKMKEMVSEYIKKLFEVYLVFTALRKSRRLPA